MDIDADGIVEGGAAGIARVVATFREAGIPVSDAYLIKSHAEESIAWRIRLVTTSNSRDVILKRIRLEREGKLPKLARDMSIVAIPAEAWEARSILGYANRAASRPVEMRNVGIDGMLIEYALVPELPTPDRAAA